MKALKYLAIVPLALSLVGFAQAKTTDYQVPFYNVVVNPGDTVYAGYSFAANKQTVICSTDTTPPTAVSWIYKKDIYTVQLPNGGSVTLKDNSSFQGYFADPTGAVSITNNAKSGAGNNLLVSCIIKDAK